ncbi:LexA family protein [Methylobacterium gnaphalii]|uniref:HTH cro/C1-type domain-containing protein n=1 Tax=Methylobacterium gnaphalii TaxID=1010610 RepID=A0A512JPA9_9HYPH|nr:S24 family peptidase [Methylobacterium gnaphalii]GEP11795.1 hypothetical protein MGN01_36400 [Methylobacterium gnaphalii]GJD69472.1 LexA repressor [Methylobacterium gnaphalii]GLS49570.1 hypothetical protein GCM10007885_24190 [Methylobacterium gnaphalii]
MSAELKTMLERIDARIKEMRSSDREISEAATGSLYTIRNMRRGSVPGFDVIAKLANALQMSPSQLAYGEGKAEAPRAANVNIPIIGRVAAGLWLEVDTYVDAPLYSDIPLPPDPDYPVDWQFAVEVQGTSVNRVAPDGAILGCISVEKSRREPREGDLVIAEQRRADGMELMRTAKRFHRMADGFELRPDSYDPKWEPIIIYSDDRAEEGSSIKVIGIVTWIHAPLRSLDRSRTH